MPLASECHFCFVCRLFAGVWSVDLFDGAFHVIVAKDVDVVVSSAWVNSDHDMSLSRLELGNIVLESNLIVVCKVGCEDVAA